MDLSRAIQKDAALLRRQQKRKKDRDNTWVTSACPLTESVFQEAVRYLKETNHLFTAWVEKSTPSESEELIMLKLGPHKLSIEHEGNQWVLEKGAGLSVSKQAGGQVIVVLYPYSSEVRYHRQKEFMLTGPMEPLKLTERKLQGYLKDLLLLANVTSIEAGAGSLVPWKALRMRILILKDFRNRQDLLRSTSKTALNQVFGWLISFLFGAALVALAWMTEIIWY